MATFEEIRNSKRFKEILEQIPEAQRAQVEEALITMATDFEEKVLKPLEVLLKR